MSVIRKITLAECEPRGGAGWDIKNYKLFSKARHCSLSHLETENCFSYGKEAMSSDECSAPIFLTQLRKCRVSGCRRKSEVLSLLIRFIWLSFEGEVLSCDSISSTVTVIKVSSRKVEVTSLENEPRPHKRLKKNFAFPLRGARGSSLMDL
jgi:hypothetical protein